MRLLSPITLISLLITVTKTGAGEQALLAPQEAPNRSELLNRLEAETRARITRELIVHITATAATCGIGLPQQTVYSMLCIPLAVGTVIGAGAYYAFRDRALLPYKKIIIPGVCYALSAYLGSGIGMLADLTPSQSSLLGTVSSLAGLIGGIYYTVRYE